MAMMHWALEARGREEARTSTLTIKSFSAGDRSLQFIILSIRFESLIISGQPGQKRGNMARNPCDAGCDVTCLPFIMEDDMTQPVSVTMRQSQRTRSCQSFPGKRYSEPLANTAHAKDVVRLLDTGILAHALSQGKQLAQQSEKIFRERLLKINQLIFPHSHC